MKSFDEICREAVFYVNDLGRLKHLWEYVKQNRLHFTPRHYEFMKWFIRDIEIKCRMRMEQEEAMKRLDKDDD